MQDMDWKVLNELYELKDLEKVSASLHMSLPNVIAHIRSVEQEMDVIVANNTKNGIEFTEAGIYLADCARMQVGFLEQVKENLNKYRLDQCRTLSIGTSYTFSQNAIPHIIQEYRRHYPNIQAEFIQISSEKLVHLLELNQLNAAFVRGNFTGNFEKIKFSEDLGFIINAKPMMTAQLPSYNAISYSTGGYTQELIQNWWNTIYDTPIHSTETASFVDSAIDMALEGKGYTIAFIPQSKVRELRDYGACLYPINNDDGVQLSRPTYFLYKADDNQPDYVNDFIRLVKNYRRSY